MRVLMQPIFNFGVSEKQSNEINLRVRFSNGIFISLPIVYGIFMLIDLDTFFKPLSEQAWDQFIVPVFILFSLTCLFLNSKGLTFLSRLTFVLMWPFFLHIIPIIIQHTPTDYYIATPFGVVFHSILIQAMFSRKDKPVVYYSLLLWNLGMLLYLKTFLIENNLSTAEKLSVLVKSDYFFLDTLLYWLLFNLIVFFLIRIINDSQRRITQSKALIESQKNDLELTLTKLQKTQSQLIQSEKMASLGTFTAGIAHELNNPMNFVAGGLEMLGKSMKTLPEDEKETLKEAHDFIKQGLDRSSKIIKSLLNLSYPGNQSSPHQYVTHIHQIIDDTLVLISKSAPYNVKFVTNYLTEVPIMAFPDKLHQVLLNIISNAIDAISENKEEKDEEITITTNTVKEHGTDHYIVTIRNTGSHIDPSELSRIFDPFYTTKDQGKGTGLGLWISYTLVNEHNGHLHVQNTADGVSFEINLPYEPLVG